MSSTRFLEAGIGWMIGIESSRFLDRVSGSASDDVRVVRYGGGPVTQIKSVKWYTLSQCTLMGILKILNKVKS